MEEEIPKVEEEIEDAIGALKEGDVEGEHFDSEDELETKKGEEESKEETIEDIAGEYGWNRDFKGETKLTAAEFLRKGEDIRISTRKSLKEQKRKLESMENVLRDIKDHYAANTRAQAAKHKKQIEALRKQRIEAIEEGDPERVDEIEGEMYDIYQTADTPEGQKEPQADPEEVAFFNDWRKANPWYAPTGKGGDMDMTQFADEQAAELEKYPSLPYERKLEIVTKRVEKKFSKSPKPPVPSVESPRPGRAKKQFSPSDLNSEERTVMKNLVRNKVLTQDEYMRDWAKQREA